MRNRTLQKLSATMMIIMLGMLAFATPAWAVELVVDSNGDGTSSERCGDADCTLREAILDSNAIPGDDTISFDPNILGEISLASELPPLGGNLEIRGPGAEDLTISRPTTAATLFRVFTVGGGRTVTISGLTISGGNVGDGFNGDVGGGLYNAGTLTLERSVVSGNSATRAGGVFNAGTANVSNSTISGNYGFLDGGGVFNIGTANISNSTVSGNRTNSVSSGLHNGSRSTMNVSNSTVSGNRTGLIGGIDNRYGGTVNVSGSIIAGNPGTADVEGPLNLDRFNFIGGDPRLGPLADNGGPTQTHLPLDGSPVLDKGNAFGSTTDQRGEPRPQDNPAIENAPGGDGSDIGAAEAFSLAVSDAAVAEGGPGTTDATFTVGLSRPASGTVTLTHATANGTATAGEDYEAVPATTLTFAPGETRKTIAVPVKGDRLDEPDETFSVNLSDAQGAQGAVLDATATGTILNDDSPNARDDSYTTNRDTMLVVGAPGVLGNDDLPEGNPLSATRSGEPSNGILSFADDGSFRYAPNTGFVGTDSFTYRISGSTNQGNTATVRITVSPPPDTTRPSVLKASPTGTRVFPTANVTAAFSEAMSRPTLNKATVKLVKRGTRTPVAASVSVSADNRTVTLNPTRSLVRGASYTATITTGAKDLAGNPLVRAKVWSFTVRR